MPSNNDSKPAALNGALTRAGQEAMISRARELIADPDYPTAAIVEELAELLMQQAADPTGS